MYIVYFNNKTIRFDRVAHIEGSLRIDGGTLLRMVDIAKLLQIIENSDSIEILSEDFEAVFSHFCSFFVEVEAAGGVVADGEGRVVTEGGQILIGGNDSYVAMCHSCWKRAIAEQEN